MPPLPRRAGTSGGARRNLEERHRQASECPITQAPGRGDAKPKLVRMISPWCRFCHRTIDVSLAAAYIAIRARSRHFLQRRVINASARAMAVDKMKRKLTTIFCADVQSYSAL